MAYSSVCGPCNRRNAHSSCSVWCTDCEEGLCDKCCKDHQALRLTRSHHVLTISSRLDVEKYKVLAVPNCENHPDFTFDLFCHNHDVICCKACLTENHKLCENVSPLSDAATGIRKSELLGQLYSDMKKNKKTTNKHLLDRTIHEEEIKRQHEKIKKEISNAKSKYFKRIDILEKALLAELSEVKPENQDSGLDIVTLHELDSEVEKNLRNLQFINEYGSENQLFAFIQIQKQNQIKLSSKLRGIPPGVKVILKFEEASNECQKIDSIGFLSVFYEQQVNNLFPENSFPEEERTNRDDKFESITEFKIDPNTFKIEKSEKIKEFEAMKFCSTKDGNILIIFNAVVERNWRFADYRLDRNRLYLVKTDENLKPIKTFDIRGDSDYSANDKYPFLPVACIPSKDIVVLAYNKQLHFIDTMTFEKKWKIYTGCECFSLTANVNLIGTCTNSITNVPMISMIKIANKHDFTVYKEEDIETTAKCRHHRMTRPPDTAPKTTNSSPTYVLLYDTVGRLMRAVQLETFKIPYNGIHIQPNDTILCSLRNTLYCVNLDGNFMYSFNPCIDDIDILTSNHSTTFIATNSTLLTIDSEKEHVQTCFQYNPNTIEEVIGIGFNNIESKVFILSREIKDKNEKDSKSKTDSQNIKLSKTNDYRLQVFKVS